MTKNEFLSLTDVVAQRKVLRGADLKNQTPRTLIYGYTCNRDTFHIYLDTQGIIWKVVYENSSSQSRSHGLSRQNETDVLDNQDYVPDKRMYPEACDFEFCQLLKEHGCYLTPTTYNENRDLSVPFHGKLVDDITWITVPF